MIYSEDLLSNVSLFLNLDLVKELIGKLNCCLNWVIWFLGNFDVRSNNLILIRKRLILEVGKT